MGKSTLTVQVYKLTESLITFVASMSHFRRAVLIFCMLWAPLQSVAAALAGAHCAEDVAEAYVHIDTDAVQLLVQDFGFQDQEGGGQFSANAHDCCHHHLSVPVVSGDQGQAVVTYGGVEMKSLTWLSIFPDQPDPPKWSRLAFSGEAIFSVL